MKLLSGRNRQIIIAICVILTFAANAAAFLLPLNGKPTQQIADLFPVYFRLPGFSFAIWALIYLGLIAFMIYQARPQARNAPWLDVVAAPLIIATIANISWLFLWHWMYINSTLVPMLVLLLSLIYIYDKLEIGFYPVSRMSYWAVHFPFAIYLSWISVATIANVSIVLYNLGATQLLGFHGGSWAAGLCVLAAILAGVAMLRNRDYAFAAVVIWALVGILVKFWDQKVQVLLFGIALSFGIILISAGFSLIMKRGDEVEFKNKLKSLAASKPL